MSRANKKWSTEEKIKMRSRMSVLVEAGKTVSAAAETVAKGLSGRTPAAVAQMFSQGEGEYIPLEFTDFKHHYLALLAERDGLREEVKNLTHNLQELAGLFSRLSAGQVSYAVEGGVVSVNK